MKLQTRTLLACAPLLLLSACVQSGSPSAGPPSAGPRFDYYLLTLSWSPEFCYSHPASPECSQHLGLIVHGLWPQDVGAPRGPENCGSQPGPANPGALLDIMPTVSLIEHEWSTHGTCSGLTADQYFGLVRRLFTRFHAPPELQNPDRPLTVSVSELKRDMTQANPGFNESEIALSCRGRYLDEVELCFTTDGQPRPCAALRECRDSHIVVSAIR